MAGPASSFFTFGTVTDTTYGVIADTADDFDLNPDLPVASGTATFTPSLNVPLLFTSAPFVAIPQAVMGIYDDQGRLSLNGSPGVRLVATDNPLETVTGWTWQVAFDLQVNGVSVKRPGFSFKLPGNSTVDLSSVQTIATVNGIPTTAGPKGDPGTGILIRGMYVGTSAAALPSGYGAAQAGWAYRVRSTDGTFDRIYAWVWTGSAGSWVDCGPMVAAGQIDDNTSSGFTTYSSAAIDAKIAAALSAAQNYAASSLASFEPDDYIRYQLGDGSWPLRNAPGDRHVTWVGTDFPPVDNGYAVLGMDSAELVAALP